MPIAEKYVAPFIPNQEYHIYNRTNNKERLFLIDDDRRIFMQKFHRYLYDYFHILSFNLMQNHFHFVLKTRSEEEIRKILGLQKTEYLSGTQIKYLKGDCDLNTLLIREITRFCQSYAAYFNIRHQRKGNLFYRTFKRVMIMSKEQLRRCIIYVNTNPVHHLNIDFKRYAWSSWQALISDSPTYLNRQECFNCFGGKDVFIFMHENCKNEDFTEVLEIIDLKTAKIRSKRVEMA